jgi:hypothetical protein
MLEATHYSTMLSFSDSPGCTSQRKEVEILKKKMAILEANDQNITISEIYRSVEKKLCLEAVGGSASR